jgi:hypothetical protein
MIEEVDWERAYLPDPEIIRQQVLERELWAARVSPRPNDIWSGNALNTLLRHLITQTAEGARGPRVPISEDTAKRINVKVGHSVGNVAMLKNQGELNWPESLQGPSFKATREQISSLMQRAYRSVDSANNPDAVTLNDLLAQYRKLRGLLASNVIELRPDEYVEAQRFVTELSRTIKELQDPNVVRQFSDEWRPTKARSVAELVNHMRNKGLLFAPASQSDLPSYMALYHALAAFDAGLERTLSDSNRGLPDYGDNR